MKRLAKLGFWLLPLLASLSFGQSIKVACPAGTTSIPPVSPTFDVTTGQLNQWLCVDVFGTVYVQANFTFSLPLIDPIPWSTTAPGVRIDPPPIGFTDNVIGTGQESRIITAKAQLPDPAQNIFYSAGVFEAWTGTYMGGALTGPAIVTINATADRNLGTYTGQLFSFVGFCRDSTTTGLLGKGPMRCQELDMTNSSGGNAVYGGVSSSGAATNSDWENNGLYIGSTGANKAGIGVRVGSNNPGAGNWIRAATLTDYDQTGLDIIRGAGNGEANLTFDTLGTGVSSVQYWNSNGTTLWVGGKNATDDWTLFDGNSATNRIAFLQGANANTVINANGNGHVVIGNPIEQSGTAFASLGTPVNGTFVYCPDCTIANPCAGGGTGAFAKRLNGVWVCN